MMADMTFRYRSIIDTIPSYRQGRPAPQREGVRAYKISSNENPFAPLPGVVEAIENSALGTINRYPDMRGWALVERLAALHGVDPEEVVLGCGSTEVITMVVRLVAGPGDEVVYPWRSFEAYPIIVADAGATSVQVPNRADGGHDVEGIIAALSPRTRLVVVNNPNNPTSVSLTRQEMERMVRAVPEDVLIVVDEAYVQFNTDPDTCDGMALFAEHPNVVVARTFSKAYGLAGLRVGYAVARREIIEGMRKVALPFGVSDVAQSAAIASLDQQDALNERVEVLVRRREWLVDELRRQGWTVPQPYANFVWLPVGDRTMDMAAACECQGLSVRAFDGEGVRVSIGEVEACERFVSVCAGLRSQWYGASA